MRATWKCLWFFLSLPSRSSNRWMFYKAVGSSLIAFLREIQVSWSLYCWRIKDLLDVMSILKGFRLQKDEKKPASMRIKFLSHLHLLGQVRTSIMRQNFSSISHPVWPIRFFLRNFVRTFLQLVLMLALIYSTTGFDANWPFWNIEFISLFLQIFNLFCCGFQ